MANGIQTVAKADARLVTGDLRSGKTCFIVGSAKDDYYLNLNGLVVPNNSGQIIKAGALKQDDWDELKRKGIKFHPFKYVKVFSEDMRQSKVIRIPKDYLVWSPVKIFSNFHLYGLRYALIGITQILEDINGNTIEDAWFLSDEAAWLDKRQNMSMEGKTMGSEFISSIGKRRLHFLQTVPYQNFIEGRYIQIATIRVLCKYDPGTNIITADVKDGGNPSQSVDIYAPYYWPNYNANERPHTEEGRINRALKKFVVAGV